MSCEEMKNIIKGMATENYEDFIKALISFEKGINAVSYTHLNAADE